MYVDICVLKFLWSFEIMFCIRMDAPPERYYPGLDLVYDREHRARLIARGDMDLAEEVRQIMFSIFLLQLQI